VRLDGYNNINHRTGESKRSARREFFYYDETDPNVPYIFNLLMDPTEKIDQESEEWGYANQGFDSC